MKDSEGQSYFETPELRRIIGRIYGQVIQQRGIHYLKGPIGAGKSRIADRLARLLASKYQVLQLAVNPMMEIQSLVRAELALPPAELDDWPPTELTVSRLEAQPLLLIIDDAELLEKQDVRALWALNKVGIVIVFVGKGGFAAGLQLKNISEWNIPLFTREQCREYLGAQGVSSFDDNSLEELFSISRGCAGKINEMALLQKWQSDGEGPGEVDEHGRPGMASIVVIAGLLITAIGVWVFLEYGSTRSLPVASETGSASRQIPKPPVKPYQKATVVELPESMPVLSSVQAPSPEVKVKQPLESEVAEVRAPATVVDDSLIEDRQWIQAQAPAAVTLQVAGAWDQPYLRNMIERADISGKSAIFMRIRQQKPWYSLVIGVYPDRSDAIAANKSISAKFGVKDAWIRTFAEIQAIISPQ